jgi:DNA-binding response OmpR family regulator
MDNARHILLAEDDDDYAFITEAAFRRAGRENRVQRVTSSDGLIAYMEGAGKYADRKEHPLPGMVIYALRLPLLHGFEALRWIRQRHEFDHIRIVVFSGIEYDNERGIALELGANCYRVKPNDFESLVQVAAHLCERCLEPGEHRAAA